MPRRKRKPPVRDVRCTVRVIVGGRTVKTIRRKLTMAQAIREVGCSEPVEIEGRLLTGVPLNRKRAVVRGVSVVLMYVADHRPMPQTCSINLNLNDAVRVIRAGVPV
jgi:hypothetical protein